MKEFAWLHEVWEKPFEELAGTKLLSFADHGRWVLTDLRLGAAMLHMYNQVQVICLLLLITDPHGLSTSREPEAATTSIISM